MLKRNKHLPRRGFDSKKLSAGDREQYSDFLKTLEKDKKIRFSINHVSNKVIDTRGLSFAIKHSIALGIKKLKLICDECDVRLDGGLKLPQEFKKQKTIIKGDEKEPVIAWASILAKVSRDALMKKHAKKFPLYGFEIHKGYGTEKHRFAIKKHGITPLHRKTFTKSHI